MPTLNLPPDSNVTLEPPPTSSRYYPRVFSSYTYAVLWVIALLIAVRFVATRLRLSQKARQWSRSGHHRVEQAKNSRGADFWTDSAPSYTKRDSAVQSRGPSPALSATVRSALAPWRREKQQGVGLGFDEKSQRAVWAAGLLPLGARTGRSTPAKQLPGMDGNDGDKRWDSLGSAAPPAPRGVSTSPGTSGADLERQLNDPSPAIALSGLSAEKRKGSRSPRSSQAHSLRRDSASSDGADDQTARGKGKLKGKGPIMDGGSGSSWPDTRGAALAGETMAAQFGDGLLTGTGAARDADYTTSPSRRFSRPPPPLPLTPPTLSGAAFPFEDRRPSYAVSVPPELDTTSFIHRPNPDYITGSSTSADVMSASPKSAIATAATTGTPRRRSYNKSVPVGPIPIPAGVSASSSEESMATMTSTDTFSPSSYPPTSPLLPPPPPGHDFPYYEYEFDGGGHGQQQEIDLQGEIISVMDDAGHGWKRHTRVYGGGVCLACLASGGHGQGGFYGDKVPLEERR